VERGRTYELDLPKIPTAKMSFSTCTKRIRCSYFHPRRKRSPGGPKNSGKDGGRTRRVPPGGVLSKGEGVRKKEEALREYLGSFEEKKADYVRLKG